ncbi:MAG: hypothetical protein ALECFALPRED_003483 [Alectoria fallacina]|uniref:Uncharacterized protein n=1 Tax=Alectoria fallacina TaxID=1903189 RepID=A0A8H3FMP8_9LECA|nr:MAG: hypothetical protein ALECFALPRED_003483 [Alectoria fallacina]
MVSPAQSMESLSMTRSAHPQAQQSATQSDRSAIGPPHVRRPTQPPTDDPPWKVSERYGGDQEFWPSATDVVGGSRLGALAVPAPTSPTSRAQYEYQRARDDAQGPPRNPSRRLNVTIITAPGQKKQGFSSSSSSSSSSEDDDDDNERNPPPSKRRRPAPAKREESPSSGGAGRRRRPPAGR